MHGKAKVKRSRQCSYIGLHIQIGLDAERWSDTERLLLSDSTWTFHFHDVQKMPKLRWWTEALTKGTRGAARRGSTNKWSHGRRRGRGHCCREGGASNRDCSHRRCKSGSSSSNSGMRDGGAWRLRSWGCKWKRQRERCTSESRSCGGEGQIWWGRCSWCWIRLRQCCGRRSSIIGLWLQLLQLLLRVLLQLHSCCFREVEKSGEGWSPNVERLFTSRYLCWWRSKTKQEKGEREEKHERILLLQLQSSCQLEPTNSPLATVAVGICVCKESSVDVDAATSIVEVESDATIGSSIKVTDSLSRRTSSVSVSKLWKWTSQPYAPENAAQIDDMKKTRSFGKDAAMLTTLIAQFQCLM